MKKILIFSLFFLCFTGQQIKARAVLSGESLWAMQRLVTQASCDVTIRQIDLSGGVFTISSSGVYCLAENITGKIVIDTNNVVLDLNGKTMTNASANCVEVNGRSNALIKNGSVIAANNIGVSVLTGSDQVSVKNVRSYDCSTGIDIDNATNIYIQACDLIASSVGVAFTTVSRAQVSDTTASDSELTGFLLDSSSKMLFTNCHALNTGEGLTDETANIYGFLSADGSSNIFSECVAQNTLALTVTGISNVTAGFALTGTESNSQITKCTSTVVETNANGFSIPYGILLQYSFDALTTVTAGNQGTGCFAVSWSPDGAYLATGGTTQGADEIQIFSFDRVNETLTKTDGQNQGSDCLALDWSPDGSYLASAGSQQVADEIQIFSFDRANGTLTKTDGTSQGVLGETVAWWSPSGAFLATGGLAEGADEIQLFSFDRVPGTITKTDGQNQGGACRGLGWSPDEAYLATTGGTQSAAEIQIFPFDRVTGTLGTRTDGKGQGTNGWALAWSSDGAYLATGGTQEAGNEIQVFSFNSTTGVLTFVTGQNQGATCFGVAWSPDGAFLATAGETQDGHEVQVFSFNRETGTLTKIDGESRGTQGEAVAWSPDGAYLAAGGDAEGLSEFQVFKALLFPSRNTITNNIVQSVSRSSSLAAGIGISGSSVENFIATNSSYNNAGFNYQFVTNVFDERFTQIPAIIQNISIKRAPLFYAP